jgi:putative AbiEii toxin of type IV toxin-antitoxin system
MRITSFTVQGFTNFTSPVTLGPLEEINVIYGPNNAGKSNLLRALELYFRLLGAGETASKAQAEILDHPDEGLERLLEHAFNRSDPQPITFDVEWSILQRELEEAGLAAEHPCSRIRTELEVRPVNRAVELRIQKWLLEDKDAAVLDKTKDGPLVQFAVQTRRFLADARPFQFDRPVLPYARLDAGAGAFPQPLRDALFDARQSIAPAQRRRWRAFADLAATLRAELGDGTWDTAFDRATGQADLVYVQGEQALTPEMMGAGVQRLACLLAELVLAQERFICLEEPEWRLSPELQARFVSLARRVITGRLGPQQLFLTTHSPVLAGLGKAFAMEVQDGAPAIEAKPWTSAPAGFNEDIAANGMPGAGDPEASLGELIGLVESLAEIDPDKILAGAGTGPSPAPPGSRR